MVSSWCIAGRAVGAALAKKLYSFQQLQRLHAQVTVLSEGRQLFFGPPSEAVPWFGGALGYAHSPARDGAVSDWLMDLVSIAFNKPSDCAERWVVKSEHPVL